MELASYSPAPVTSAAARIFSPVWKLSGRPECRGGCPRFDFLPGSWVCPFLFCAPHRSPRPVRHAACAWVSGLGAPGSIFYLGLGFALSCPVIPTGVPRSVRHAVEGSRHNLNESPFRLSLLSALWVLLSV